MPYILMKLHGTGASSDPLTVNFPTFKLYAHDEASGLAVLEVDALDTPSGMPLTPFNAQWLPDGMIDAIRLVGQNSVRLTAHIRGRYREGFSQWDAREEEG